MREIRERQVQDICNNVTRQHYPVEQVVKKTADRVECWIVTTQVRDSKRAVVGQWAA